MAYLAKRSRVSYPISSHGLVVKRMTSNHEILGSTPSVSIFLLSFYIFDISLARFWRLFV
jgi:hypothetical protein